MRGAAARAAVAVDAYRVVRVRCEELADKHHCNDDADCNPNPHQHHGATAMAAQ